MIRRSLAIAATLLAVVAVASPALTASPKAVGVWIDVHFVDAKGKTKTVVIPLTYYKPDTLEAYCANPKKMASFTTDAYMRDPRLANWTFVGANCERDSAGNIKVAIGTWPKGKGPGYTEQPGFSINVQGSALKGAPAVVVLHFIATNGHPVNTVFGYAKRAVFHMKTCPAVLAEQKAFFIEQAQIGREATASPRDEGVRPYSLRGLKFIGAECVPPPKMIGDLGWPDASVEFGYLPPGYK